MIIGVQAMDSGEVPSSDMEMVENGKSEGEVSLKSVLPCKFAGPALEFDFILNRRARSFPSRTYFETKIIPPCLNYRTTRTMTGARIDNHVQAVNIRSAGSAG